MSLLGALGAELWGEATTTTSEPSVFVEACDNG